MLSSKPHSKTIQSTIKTTLKTKKEKRAEKSWIHATLFILKPTLFAEEMIRDVNTYTAFTLGQKSSSTSLKSSSITVL